MFYLVTLGRDHQDTVIASVERNLREDARPFNKSGRFAVAGVAEVGCFGEVGYQCISRPNLSAGPADGYFNQSSQSTAPVVECIEPGARASVACRELIHGNEIAFAGQRQRCAHTARALQARFPTLTSYLLPTTPPLPTHRRRHVHVAKVAAA